eukprot:2904172-Rhodomonas_salina.1
MGVSKDAGGGMRARKLFGFAVGTSVSACMRDRMLHRKITTRHHPRKRGSPGSQPPQPPSAKEKTPRTTYTRGP